jgi:hypothetical protein
VLTARLSVHVSTALRAASSDKGREEREQTGVLGSKRSRLKVYRSSNLMEVYIDSPLSVTPWARGVWGIYLGIRGPPSVI